MAGYLRRLLAAFAALSALFVWLLLVFERDSFSIIVSDKAADESAIKGTVALYNKIVTDIYVSGGIPSMLNELPASKRLKHELFKDVGYLRDRDRIQIYDMADFAVLDVSMLSPRTAEETVYEEWNYLFRKAVTRELAAPIKGMEIGLKYSLAKNKNGWFVVNYVPVEIDYEKKDEFTY